MYTVIRNYTGAPGLAGELKKHGKDIEAEISGVPGFNAYYLIQTSDGVASMTVCEDRIGCDESTQRAQNWLRKNLPNLKAGPPQVIAGEVMLKFWARKTAKL